MTHHFHCRAKVAPLAGGAAFGSSNVLPAHIRFPLPIIVCHSSLQDGRGQPQKNNDWKLTPPSQALQQSENRAWTFKPTHTPPNAEHLVGSAKQPNFKFSQSRIYERLRVKSFQMARIKTYQINFGQQESKNFHLFRNSRRIQSIM